MLLLASKSPRRKELLSQLGVKFTTLNVDINETPLANERSEDYVLRLAVEKAQAGLALQPNAEAVMGADTVVVANTSDGEVLLGKPDDYAHAVVMWKLLGGQQHQVMTAVALACADSIIHCVVVTDVWFKALTEQEMLWYWHSGEPQDKAGAYGIQGLAGQFVSKINGSYSAVVGLPLFETKQLINQMDIK
ncbi:Maf family protein [Aliiglaciecola sp. LCG003]|uniref:Maf family protein n=1 Tax=Aliiglaciecola sp. LCG003 TaxID=3053655 RepID=UPI00257403EB|nr:Maf family protein [Aliiglaciecola sp. LCG003]WJG09719.1 Maf family protein [Aliiglaciecola sp. LCG003]